MSGGSGDAGAPAIPSAWRPASLLWRPALAAAVLVQLVVLYAPSGPGASPFPNSDKVVHVAVFLLPVAVALGAGIARWLVVTVFAAHAVVSEVVQGVLLPSRAGDGWDVVADLVGVGLGVTLWWAVVRSRRWSGGRRAAGRLVLPPR